MAVILLSNCVELKQRVAKILSLHYPKKSREELNLGNELAKIKVLLFQSKHQEVFDPVAVLFINFDVLMLCFAE